MPLPHRMREFGQLVFDFLVQIVATFLAAVLSHPAVKEAGANLIVAGMNAFVQQPELDRQLMTMNQTVSRHQDELARTAGEDFPKIVGSFIQGMINPRRDKQHQQRNLHLGGSENTTTGHQDAPNTSKDAGSLGISRSSSTEERLAEAANETIMEKDDDDVDDNENIYHPEQVMSTPDRPIVKQNSDRSLSRFFGKGGSDRFLRQRKYT